MIKQVSLFNFKGTCFAIFGSNNPVGLCNLPTKKVITLSSPVVDFHIHPIYYEQYNESSLNWIKGVHAGKNWQEFYDHFCDAEKFMQFLQDNGVDYGVVLAELAPAATGICSNEYVLRFCSGQERLIPFASVNPYMIPNARKELKRLADAGFRGIKLYPTYQLFYPNDRLIYPIYAQAEELQIPVMVHTGSSVFKGSRLKYGDPLYLDDVAVDFPNLNIILVHSGRGFWYDRAFFLARLHDNVYMEVAGLPPQKLMTYFPELERVADKIIFGSDWPGLTDLRGNIEAIRNLPLKKESKEKILGKNAVKLLGLQI